MDGVNSKSKFLKNSVVYTIGDLLPKVITFFMIPVLTGHMSKADYGIYNYLIVLIGFFSMAYVLGLDGALTRFYYEYKDKGKEKELISSIWIFLLIYDILISIVLLFLGKGIISKLILKDIPFKPYFIFLVLICFFTTFSSLPLVLVRLREQAFRFGLFNIITTIVNVFFIFYFVSYKKQGAEGNLKANLITYVIFSIVYFILNFKDLKPVIAPKIIKGALKYGIPLIPHALGAWILMSSDRFFLNMYRTKDELGIYGLGYQFGMLVYFLIVAVNKAYVPFFFKTAEEEKENAPKVFEEIIRYYLVIIITIGFGLALFSKEIISIMVPNKSYHIAYTIVPLIALAYILNGFYFMSVNGIFYSKKTYILPVSTGISAVVDVILNYLLIPKYGMYGAAIATASAYLVLFIVTYYYSQKFYYIKWQWKNILLNGSLGIALFYVGKISISSLLLSILFKIALFLVYIGALFLFKILSYEKLKYYMKKILKR